MRIFLRDRCSDFDSYRAARVTSLLNAESGRNLDLHADMPGSAAAGGRLCVLLGEQALAALVLPEPRLIVDAVPGAFPPGATEGAGRAYDLVSESIGAFAWRAREASQGGELRMEAALDCAVPTLLVFAA